MTDRHIRPDDVSPEDARRVLDALNAAETAEELAAAIEIPGERDVGVGVARRILDRRRELGRFASLRQVADVAQVGPERFTEIVATLSRVGGKGPAMTQKKGTTLRVPIDASGVEDFDPKQPVRVVAQARDGTTTSQTVRLDKEGKGEANLAFRDKPGPLRVALGPDTASDEELLHSQTIAIDVPTKRWDAGPEVQLNPTVVSSYHWHWWLKWCRDYTIRGRVLCPDGSPVPGAKVCAHDVDLWWMWSSIDEVSCAVTDANGAFEIKFRWCCGWRPWWWWWTHRFWRLEPFLADRIQPVLQRDLKLRDLPRPTGKPNLAVFDQLLTEEGLPTRQPLAEIDPNAMERLRRPLLELIPVIPELQSLRIWPWRPWRPWWDCTPDIIFRVTQDCLGEETVIVDEDVGDTRWNIPTTLEVNLVANEDACCIDPDDTPEGVCTVITHACDDPIQFIGGNPGAALTPAGYRNPGVVAPHGDRPFGGVVPIRGLFGDAANVDYYEFEWSDDGGTTWNAMPAAAAGGFHRTYWGPTLGGGPVGFHSVPFSFADISGQRVVESREHFEANNDPASWGMTRFWTGGRNLLIRWITQNTNQSLNFPDGTFHLRIKSWDIDSSGNLVSPPRILPLCDTAEDNSIVLTIDNRLTGAGSGHPTAPDHVCGGGTVHVCTTEPDTDFLGVRINGAAVEACAIVDATDGGQLEIDFMAHDPDGHLGWYTLRANYRENLSVNLLNAPGAVLTPGPGGAPVPLAAQVGPWYGAFNPAISALDQGAVAPTWHGGTITLTIPDLSQAFPESCCYSLELRAYKRTIDDCDDNWPHRNRSHYTFTVQV